MKVTWIDHAEACDPKAKFIGGLGGWVDGHGWFDYIEKISPRERVYYEALREQIVKDQIRRGGDWHQDHGVPLFEDGTMGSFSYRAWGDLLAAIWNTEEDTVKYSYMNFYMGGYAGCQA